MTEDKENLVEVKIGALIMDPNTNSPIVVLKGVHSDVVLPIWVGSFEANAIALEIEKIAPQRPMTHDLLRNLIIVSGLNASRVIITRLIENTFYASIELTDENGKLVTMDARPSDAIAIALRLDCPVFVEPEVLEQSAVTSNIQPEIDEPDTAAEEWPELID